MSFRSANPNPDCLVSRILMKVLSCELSSTIVVAHIYFLFGCKKSLASFPSPMGRKRRAPASFDWSAVPEYDDEPAPLPDIRIRHSHIHLDRSGASSSNTTYIPAPASPSKRDASFNYVDDNYNWNNEPAPPEINTANYPFLDPAYTHYLDINEPGPPRRPRTFEVICIVIMEVLGHLLIINLQDDPLIKWIKDRNLFLHELIRLEGRGDEDLRSSCRLCGSAPDIRCEDCFGGEMFCQRCTIDLHAVNPLHRIEVHIYSHYIDFTDLYSCIAMEWHLFRADDP